MSADLRTLLTDNLGALDIQISENHGLTPAAVAIAITEDEAGEPAFILTRRSGRLRRHARQWALPGGRQDPGETLLETALREMDEEIGLPLAPNTLLGQLDDYPTRSGYCISTYVFWAGPTPVLTPNPDEVYALYRIRLEELNRHESPDIISIPESDRPVIRMAIMDDMVHAPTAAILYQFREVAMHRRMTRVDHYEQPVFAWG